MLVRIAIVSIEPLIGTAVAGRRAPVPFVGWLELLRTISELVGAEERQDDRSRAGLPVGRNVAGSIQRAGRVVALLGVVLPLLLIGGLKFTPFEAEALKPLIGGTPWLAWMYPTFGEAGASYVLGVVEIATALLLAASPWSPPAGVVGGALGGLIFLVTVSLLFALPIWEASLGGFPALGGAGQFLIKDVALLGISLAALGESLARVAGNATGRQSPST